MNKQNHTIESSANVSNITSDKIVLHRYHTRVVLVLIMTFLVTFLIFLLYQYYTYDRTIGLMILDSCLWGFLLAASFKFSERYHTAYNEYPSILLQGAFYAMLCLFLNYIMKRGFNVKLSKSMNSSTS
jgi:hypothetical protein